MASKRFKQGSIDVLRYVSRDCKLQMAYNGTTLRIENDEISVVCGGLDEFRLVCDGKIPTTAKLSANREYKDVSDAFCKIIRILAEYRQIAWISLPWHGGAK